jgi:serine/threonine protein kinase/WD40 repeat protein
MSEPEQREEAIFEAALQLPAAERAAYVDGACGGDAALQRRVEGLLAAFGRSGAFMKEPALPRDGQDQSGPAAPKERPGDRIGRYKLLEQIGEGGCGVVYVADQEEPVRRRVALKIIKLGMDTKQVIARFEAERQALALMDHPNIAKVLDAGATEAGRPYFVMELVRGIKITDFCDQDELSPRERLDLFIQVCRAVQHAHQKGIIHRDIKPSNILVTVNDGAPVPKVIDFGIAKATQGRLTDQTVYTAFEQFIGTPAYMSPEQAVMTSLDIDTRTDIYSLGVLLYELLTGTTPFDSKELLSKGLDEMRRTIREVEPAKPSTRLTQELSAAEVSSLKSNSESRDSKAAEKARASSRRLLQEVRGDIDWIVMKCLEKDRRRRYETANGLASDIERHLNNEPILARPQSNLYRFQKAVQRNKLAFGIAVALSLLPLVIIVSLLLSNERIGRERNQKESALKEKAAALVSARTSEQTARSELFTALYSQARARRYSRQMGQRVGSLEALAQAAQIRQEEGLRDEAIAAMALPDVRFGPALPFSFGTLKGLAFDGRYQRYARCDTNGIIRVCSLSSGQEILRLRSVATSTNSPTDSTLMISEDGEFLLELAPGSGFGVWRVSDGSAVIDNPPRCWIGAFSPDSRHLAVTAGDSVLRFDLATGKLTNQWRSHAAIWFLAFSPDSRRLALGYVKPGVLSIYDVMSGTNQVDLPIGPMDLQSLDWNSDGRRIAVYCQPQSSPSIQIWDVETGRQVINLEGHASNLVGLTFHPDGDLLATTSWDGTTRLWDSMTGRQLLRLPFEASINFSDDGHWLGLVNSEQPRLLEMVPGREYRSLGSIAGPGETVPVEGDISPDGRLLAMGMAHGLRLWDLASGRELGFVPQRGRATWAQFQPGNNFLFTHGPAAGLQRWPLHADPEHADSILLGPPTPIPLPFAPERIACSQDGRLLAVVSESAGQALMLDMDSGTIRGQLLPHPNAGFVALSRDGRWLATSGWHSDLVQLWDARNGSLIRRWSVPEKLTAVAFTPDNRRLVLCRQAEFSLWDLETLQQSQRLPREMSQYPGYVAFSKDGKLMAMEMAPGVVDLKEAASCRTLARLEDPFGDMATWIGFTPSGTELVVACKFAHVIHVWDLHSIRAQLKAMGLDWDWPEFPPEERRAKHSPLKLQVFKGDQN